MSSKKTKDILSKCSEIYANIECRGDEELANHQIAELLELVAKGIRCEKDIAEKRISST